MKVGKVGFESVITVILATCAIVTTIAVLRHELFSPGIGSHRGDQQAVYITAWQSHLARGLRMGPSGAPVQLIEFADFECPYCGQFHRAATIVRQRHPNQVALTYVHYLIQGHRFALVAARVAECANDQGRFEAMYDQLFEGQDQFGLKSWDDYATAAGVPDIPAFDACIKKTDPVPRVEEGKSLGAKLDVKGTPTVVINGWKLGHPPSVEELDQMVQRVFAGKSPVDQK